MQTIQNLLLDDEKDASLDYISDFSNLLRNMLEQSRNEMINLEDEIDFLKKYIKLEEIRFKNKFEVVWDVDLQEESIEEIYIPTMLIQPLIENAIKYSNANAQNQILIRERIENDFLIVKIENSYDSTVVRTKRHKSTAITVIKERLKLYSKNNVEGRFSLELEKEKAIATIFVPI
jgi:LytS/YehU family sensor histidine kinase